MELLKIFIKEEAQPVGLNAFRDEKVEYTPQKSQLKLNLNRQIFKPNYNSNFFLM